MLCYFIYYLTNMISLWWLSAFTFSIHYQIIDANYKINSNCPFLFFIIELNYPCYVTSFIVLLTRFFCNDYMHSCFQNISNKIKGNVPCGYLSSAQSGTFHFQSKIHRSFYWKSLYSLSLRGVYEIKSFSSKPRSFLWDLCIRRGSYRNSDKLRSKE